MGACRKYAVSTVCGMDSCSAGAERVGGALRRRRDVRARDAALVQPVRVRDDELQDQLRDRRGLRDRLQLRRQRVRAAGERHAVHLARGCASRATASRGSAATTAAPPPARRATSPGPSGPARRFPPGWRRRPPRSAPTWGRPTRVAPTVGATAPARAATTRPTPPAAPRAAPDRRCRRRGPVTAPVSAGPRRPARARPTPAARGRAGRPARRRPSARRGNTCVNSSCGKIPDRRCLPERDEFRLRLRVLRQQRLLQQRLHRHVHVVLADGQRRDVLTDRPGRATAGGRAVPGGRGVDVRQRRDL